MPHRGRSRWQAYLLAVFLCRKLLAAGQLRKNPTNDASPCPLRLAPHPCASPCPPASHASPYRCPIPPAGEERAAVPLPRSGGHAHGKAHHAAWRGRKGPLLPPPTTAKTGARSPKHQALGAETLCRIRLPAYPWHTPVLEPGQGETFIPRAWLV